MADTQQFAQLDLDLVQYKNFAGLRNDIELERFGPEDLSVATNVDIDRSGQLSRRSGFTLRAPGVFHSLWSKGTLALGAQNGALVAINPDYSTTPLRQLADPLSRISFAGINEQVYFSNGTDTGAVSAGTARTWGLAVPPTPKAIPTVGNMPAGVYQFTATYLAGDMQESGAALAYSTVLPDGGGLLFTVPPSPDPRVVGAVVYLTTTNGDVLYEALTLDNSGDTALYAGDTTELTYDLKTQFLGPPPAGQLVGYYRGCMFVAQGEWLFPSEPLAYELFDLRKGIALDGRITLLGVMEDKERPGESEGENSGLFVGTTNSCGVLVGKSADGFQYVPKIDYGAIEGAVAYIDGSLFGDNSAGARMLPVWLTQYGICVGMPQMEIRNLTRTRYTFTAAGKGAALFVPGPNRFTATCNF